MRPLILVFAIALAGCTRIAVDKPIGQPLSGNEVQEFAGEWIGEKEVTFTVSTNDSPGGFTVMWIEDGENKSASCMFTVLGENEVPLIWVKEDALDAYLVFRVAAGDASLTLLHPDEEEVDELVASEKIKGRHDTDQKAWILSSDGLEEFLVGKDFWNLGQATPFLKKQETARESAPGIDPDREE